MRTILLLPAFGGAIPVYVELHCHSAYSFKDGASLPEELAARAEELGYQALALTDHDGLYGSLEFARQAKACSLQPITGAEITLAPGSFTPGNFVPSGSVGASPSRNLTPNPFPAREGEQTPPRPSPQADRENLIPGGQTSHLTLLAETAVGYSNLCRLLSFAHQNSERNHPCLPWDQLRDRSEGLIVLSGCRQGALARALDRGDRAGAEAIARQLREWFGRDRFFLELQQNHVYGDTARVGALVDLARRLDLEVVATNNVHYHIRERHRLQDVLVAAKHNTTLDNSHQIRRANSEFYLKSPEEMAALFAELPDAVRNTQKIAERCAAFDITQDLGYIFPDFQREGEEEADAALARICWETLGHRYAGESAAIRIQARQRLKTELELVRHHRLAGFFLVYRDLLELGKEIAAAVRGRQARGKFALPPGRGRGSSVSSIICYLIGLSPVDPVKTKLSLGRFLNKELASIPDIDLDFPRDIREELIKAVHQRYGREHVAMVCTFPTYRIRSAVRDIGQALGLPPAEVDRLARLSEGRSADTVEEEMRLLPGFENALEAPLWRHLIDLAKELKGFPRHLSQHPGGLILSSRPLVEIVPVECSRMEGRQVCQWDKDSCDDARFIKIDFLALGMLSAVEECLNLIDGNGKPPVDLSRIDFNDQAVYDRICAADTVGVFQIESRAQMQMLPRTRPRSLEELAIEVAIVRPGPIVGGAVSPYIRRREMLREHPNAPIPFDHPLLEPALKDTLGVILYQDQVLSVCQAMAGFSVGQAEALRRSMSRRRSRAAMEQFREQFHRGAAERGVPQPIADRVFEQVLGFSQYGFPKSHASAFAILSYQSTWLCHYYPAEFVASVMNCLPMGFYPRDVLLKDAQRHGVQFRRPHINESGVLCRVLGETVLLGLCFVEGIGSTAAEGIVEERERGGPFRSLPDFVRRVPFPCGAVERLIEAGAFDDFGLERRPLLWQLGIFARAQGWMAERKPGTGSRLARQQPSLALSFAGSMVPLAPQNSWEQLVSDYRLMELSPDGHPMSLLRRALPKGIVTSEQLKQIPDGKTVYVAGLVVTRQRPGTAKGFLFLLTEDETGMVNVIVNPKVYEGHRVTLRAEPLLWMRGTVQRKSGVLNLILRDVGSLLDILQDARANPDDPTSLFLNDLRRSAPLAHSWR